MTPFVSWVAILLGLGVLALLIFDWPGQHLPALPPTGERDPAGTSQLLGLTADVPVGVTVYDWEADVCDCFLCSQDGGAA